MYQEFMKEYLTSKHRYYISHRCVLRPDSSTTELQVVLDPSSKTSISLNGGRNFFWPSVDSLSFPLVPLGE